MGILIQSRLCWFSFQDNDQTSAGEEKVSWIRSKELQKEVVSAYKSRIDIQQKKRYKVTTVMLFIVRGTTVKLDICPQHCLPPPSFPPCELPKTKHLRWSFSGLILLIWSDIIFNGAFIATNVSWLENSNKLWLNSFNNLLKRENRISCCKQLTNQMDREYKCKKSLMAWRFEPSRVFLEGIYWSLTQCVYWSALILDSIFLRLHIIPETSENLNCNNVCYVNNIIQFYFYLFVCSYNLFHFDSTLFSYGLL